MNLKRRVKYGIYEMVYMFYLIWDILFCIVIYLFLGDGCMDSLGYCV